MAKGAVMTVREQIIARLQREFAPETLEVTDDSERHRGHTGWREGGESHFSVRIVSQRFRGLSRLQRHRLVHAALSPEPMGRIHALALNLSDGQSAKPEGES